ncbi:response regulator transcription factor [Xanthobacter versatilis]|uniref:response regulator transcription factor n=1 Tax=Xanthobacter autotrophicus (strain ATCC BAA-1158 / Py2) TaxID=78245 RepID=UPI00372867E5
MPQAEALQPAPTILVVETDILVRHVIADYLRGCGYRVLEAATGEEAGLILDVEAEGIDIVLADAAATGDREGFALARWLRETYPHIDVVLAGSPAMAAAQATDLCEDGPAVDKPYQPQQLADRIRWLVARRGRNR